MWQVLVAAAAGSGILARRLISPMDTEKPISDCEQSDLECDQSESSPPHSSIVPSDDAFGESSREAFCEDGKIFRFSCPETGFKEFRKINRNGFRGVTKNGGSKRGKKNVAMEGGRKEMAGNHVQIISLKKRKTGKHVAGKCESFASKGICFFFF